MGRLVKVGHDNLLTSLVCFAPPLDFRYAHPGYERNHERRNDHRRLLLSRACAQIPAVDFRRPDWPGRDGAHDLECIRERPHSAGLGAHRRPRRRQDHDRAHPGARAQLRIARRFGHRTDDFHAGARRALPGDHGEPASRRDRDGRGLAQRRRRRPSRSTRRSATRRSRRATRSTSSTKCTCCPARPSMRC